MPLHPMLSLKSSVGSKGNSFHPTAVAEDGGDCFHFHPEHPCTAFRSSWVNRFRLRTAPPPSASETHSFGKRIAASDVSHTPSSSFIARRYLGFVPRPPRPPPKIPREDAEVQLVASFGPFQVRSYRQGERGKFEDEVKGRKLGFLDKKLQNETIGARPSPLLLKFSPQLSRIAAGVHGCTVKADPFSSSGFHSFFRPCKVEDRLQCRGYKGHSPCPWPVSGSNQRAARNVGAANGDLSDAASASRNFQGIHNFHSHVMPQQPEIQAACTNEPEESFSFWNMGRFRRANLVSSVSPSLDLAWNFGKKRKPYTDDNVSPKYKRMANEK